MIFLFEIKQILFFFSLKNVNLRILTHNYKLIKGTLLLTSRNHTFIRHLTQRRVENPDEFVSAKQTGTKEVSTKVLPLAALLTTRDVLFTRLK